MPRISKRLLKPSTVAMLQKFRHERGGPWRNLSIRTSQLCAQRKRRLRKAGLVPAFQERAWSDRVADKKTMDVMKKGNKPK